MDWEILWRMLGSFTWTSKCVSRWIVLDRVLHQSRVRWWWFRCRLHFRSIVPDCGGQSCTIDRFYTKISVKSRKTLKLWRQILTIIKWRNQVIQGSENNYYFYECTKLWGKFSIINLLNLKEESKAVEKKASTNEKCIENIEKHNSN